MRSELLATALLASLLGAGCANTSHPRFDGDDDGVYRYGYDGADEVPYDDWTTDTKLPTFEEYVKWQKGRLRKNWRELYANGFPTRSGHAPVDLVKYLEAHTPIDRSPPAGCESGPGGPRAVLLVHGLYDSPYVMRDLEVLFHDLCFHTRTLLLPGHGTRPGHLRTTRTADWERAVRFAVLRFHKEVGKPYIAGFSTGGALALREAVVHPDQVRGIFLFAPAIKVPGGRYLWLATLLGDPAWVPTQVFDDDDYVKYESIAMRSAREIDALARKVDGLLAAREKPVAVPAFTAVSLNDFTIDSPNTIRHFPAARLGDPSHLVVFSAARA